MAYLASLIQLVFLYNPVSQMETLRMLGAADVISRLD